MSTPAASATVAAAPVDTQGLVRVLAAVALVLAGVVHLVVVPEHLAEFPAAGVFFALLGLGQLGLGVALRWVRAAWLPVLAVVGHLGVVALYVASRTVDLPFVPVHEAAGHAPSHLPVAGGVGNGVPIFPGSRMEPVGALDLVCLLAELLAVGLLVALLPARPRRAMANLMLGLGLAAVLLRGVGVLS
jgi:hypothetical protein